jgi:phosphopantetheine adenylyltransferase
MENKWSKIVHIKSSMEANEKQWHMFIGRWQTLHDGHKQLFQQVLDKGGKVLIAVRQTQKSEKNPFSSYDVYKNISAFYRHDIMNGRVKVIEIPDICSVEFGRGVGYDIIEHVPPADVAAISATKIRESLNNPYNEKISKPFLELQIDVSKMHPCHFFCFGGLCACEEGQCANRENFKQLNIV